MADESTVWLLGTQGIPWYVEVGSAAHEKLVGEGAQECDEDGNVIELPEPEPAELEELPEGDEDASEDDESGDGAEPASDSEDEEVLS